MPLSGTLNITALSTISYWVAYCQWTTVFVLWQVIAKARVPIVKFVERKSGIAFDIRCSFVFIAQADTRLLLLSQFSVNNIPFLFQLWYRWWPTGSRFHQGTCSTMQLNSPVTEATCTLFEAICGRLSTCTLAHLIVLEYNNDLFPFCTVGCCEEVACFKTFMYDSESFSASERAQRGTIEQKSVVILNCCVDPDF